MIEELESLRQLVPDAERDFSSLSTGAFLTEYKSTLATLDALGGIERMMKTVKGALEKEALRRSQVEEVDKFVGDGFSLSIKEQPVVNFTEDGDWNSIVEKMTQDGMSHLIQRRISAGKLQEEMDAGYRLPDGLRIENIRQVRHRRNSQ